MRKFKKIIIVVACLLMTPVATLAEGIEPRAAVHSCGGILTDTTEYGPWGFAYEAPCVHNHPYGTDVYQKRDVIVRRSCNKCGMNGIISITEEVMFKECHGYDW